MVGFNWNECQTSFMQGTVGMWIDGLGFAKPLEDAATSKVAARHLPHAVADQRDRDRPLGP